MLINERNRSFIKRQLILLLLSTIFLLVYSRYTTPITKTVGIDAAFFQMVGQGMTKGYMPYRDFFDMKGPWLFLIEWLGQCIAYGRCGIFIVQVINLYVSLFFVDRIIGLATKKLPLFIWISLFLPYLWIASITFAGGNLTEEFSLPFLVGCFYFCIRFIKEYKRISTSQIILSGLFCGISFSFLAFVRISNAASVVSICLFVLLVLLKNKNYAAIIYCFISFVAGAILAALPVFFFCQKNGILPDMLYSVFKFGMTYAAEGGLISISTIAKNWYLFVQLLLPFASLLPFKRMSPTEKLLLVLSAINFVIVALILCLGNGYPHYFTLCLPGLTICSYTMAKKAEGKSFYMFYAKNKHRVLACCSLLCLLAPWVAYSSALSAYHILINRNPNQSALEVASKIPSEDSHQVYAYGGSCSSWYGQTGLFPCIKYCDWQEHYMQLVPDIQNELQAIFDSTPPKWLVVPSAYHESDFLAGIIDRQYSLYFENTDYCLYKQAVI